MGTIRKSTWAAFKALIQAKGLQWQFEEADACYDIFASDNGTTYSYRLLKTSPASADQTDFETNFKPSSNAPVIPGVEVRASSLTGLTVTFGTSDTRASADGLTGNEDFVVVTPSGGNRLRIRSILSSNLNLSSGVTAKFRFGSSDYFNRHNVPVSDMRMFDYPKFDLLGAVDESFKAYSTGMSYSITVEYSEA